jgi:molybdenum cofactor cytidylyltransferase
MAREIQVVAPVVLAAGDSSRMGYPKALLPIGSHTFLSLILETLGAACPGDVTVVVGRHAEEIRSRTFNPNVRFLVNPRPELGQISSIQLALRSLEPGCAGCLFWPVDQPTVSAQLVRALIELSGDSEAWVVLPACGGKRGHPAIFRRAIFQDMLDLPEGESPKDLLRSHSGQTLLIPTEETAILEDIDTPEDYYRLTGQIPVRREP